MAKKKKNKNKNQNIDVNNIKIADIDIDEIENRDLIAKSVEAVVEEQQNLETDRTQTNAVQTDEVQTAGGQTRVMETMDVNMTEVEEEFLEDITIEDVNELVADSPYAARMKALEEMEATTNNESEEDEETEVEATKGPKKNRAGNVVRSIIMLVALGVFVFAAFQLFTIFMEYKAGTDEYEDLLSQYAPVVEPDETPVVEPQYVDETYPFNPDFVKQQVLWDELKGENSEVMGWIQFETIKEINYPIVHGSSMTGTGNDYYLQHTFRGVKNSAGSIFVEENNSPSLLDTNTIIYGHNMKNGSMFGMLGRFKKQEFYAGNEYFWIYTPSVNYRFKIFSCYEPLADSDTYTWWSAPCEESAAYIEKVISNSKYPTDVQVKPDDKIVTLSTCTSRGDDYRFVVHAKLIYVENIVQ